MFQASNGKLHEYTDNQQCTTEQSSSERNVFGKNIPQSGKGIKRMKRDKNGMRSESKGAMEVELSVEPRMQAARVCRGRAGALCWASRRSWYELPAVSCDAMHRTASLLLGLASHVQGNAARRSTQGGQNVPADSRPRHPPQGSQRPPDASPLGTTCLRFNAMRGHEGTSVSTVKPTSHRASGVHANNHNCYTPHHRSSSEYAVSSSARCGAGSEDSRGDGLGSTCPRAGCVSLQFAPSVLGLGASHSFSTSASCPAGALRPTALVKTQHLCPPAL
nr:hypothetical protein Iba_chr12bCG27290 [Ipomoea batatas]